MFTVFFTITNSSNYTVRSHITSIPQFMIVNTIY